jgi:hypothetical protein
MPIGNPRPHKIALRLVTVIRESKLFCTSESIPAKVTSVRPPIARSNFFETLFSGATLYSLCISASLSLGEIAGSH